MEERKDSSLRKNMGSIEQGGKREKEGERGRKRSECRSYRGREITK